MFDFLTKKIVLNKDIEQQEKKKKVNSSKNKKIEDKWLEELNNDINSKEKYQIINDEFYILYHSKLKKEYKIKIKTVDEIFKDYSNHWNNLNWQEILEKYKLKPEVFNLIKSKLWLYKTSNVISPYTLNKLEQEGDETVVERIIEDAIEENIDTFKGKFVKTYDKKFKQEAKKAFWIVWNVEYYLENLYEVIKKYEPKKIELPNLNMLTTSNKELVIVMTDIHLGKKNTNKILEDISKIKYYIEFSKEEKIKLIFLWDLVENLSQSLMHSWQHITADINNPFELMLKAADIFSELLLDIRKMWKKVSFYWIPWNHDRVTAKNEDDMLRIGWLTIYELMKRWLSNTDIVVEYWKNTINTIDTEDFGIILSHWENWFNNKKPEDLLWKYWDKQKFNIILSWHTHQHKQEIGKGFAKIVVAPLAGPWDFDERLWLMGEVWFTSIKKWIFWQNNVEISNIIL